MPHLPTVLITRGSIAAEQALLDALEDVIVELRQRGDFRRPAWVVVPTRVLRRHLQHRLVERFGATAGVNIWTLGGLVSWLSNEPRAQSEADFPTLQEPIDAQRSVAADDAAGGDDLLLEILAARHLADVRGTSLERGRMPSAAIRDLLDAGLEIEHLAALIESLADTDVSGADVQRAEELLSAAGRTLEAIDEHDLRPARRRFALARREIEEPGEAVPAIDPGAVLVYGFADLTGVGADFLQALVNRFHATVILNRPIEPDQGTPIPAIERYLERWRSRLSPAVEADASSEPARLTCFRAARPTAELHEVGLRVRALLDQGVAPHCIGVVLRQPKLYGSIAARELRRLGIPCSAPGLPGEILPPGRRARALVDLLDQGEAAPLSRWLDARRDDRGRDPVTAVPVFALRRKLALAGLRTLGQLQGLELLDDDAPDVDRSRVEEAAQLLRIRSEWGSGDGRHHARRLGEFGRALLWADDDDLADDLRRRAADIRLRLSLEEFLVWLQRVSDDLGRAEPDPWELGGVRLLRIQDAREVTFDHLFVPGMSRGLFPRAIRGDSELREELREYLSRESRAGVLPDLPTAGRFHDEEKYLFAQVLGASPSVTLSRAERSLDERLMPASSMLSLLPRDVLDAIEAPELTPGTPGFEDRWRLLPPREREVRAGLWGRQLEDAPVHPTRRAILDEHDRAGPGPYLGWVGSSKDDADRRNRDLYVTNLESYCRCPWQTFVEKFLEVDARQDPDLVAPRLPPMAIGSLAHDLLAEVARASGVAEGGEWAQLLDAAPKPIVWPDENELRAMVEAVALRQTLKDGIHLPGYAATLARAVEVVLARARAADRGGPALLAVESWGRAELDGPGVRFKADRLEIDGGRVLATDYKTGKAKTGKVGTQVGRAEWLQLPVYLLGGAAEARLLWLGDPEHPQGKEVRASDEDVDMLEGFRALARDLTHGWRSGRFFPRVLDHRGSRPRACTWCDFTEACSERDPFARDRLQQALDDGEDTTASAVWLVGSKKSP